MVNLLKDSGALSKETVNHNSSCSEISANMSKMNGNSFKDVLKNGNCTDTSFVNGKSNKIPAKEGVLVNGHTHNKISSNEKVNGYHGQIPVEGASFNGKSNELLVSDEAEKAPVVNGKNNGGSNIPLQVDSCSNANSSDSLCNQDDSGENQEGFTKVRSRRQKKSDVTRCAINDTTGVSCKRMMKEWCSMKTHQKKPISNLPPANNSANIRHNSRSDKNCAEKTSPSHLSQKKPCTFVSAKSTKLSYSSVVANGQNGISQLRNGSPKISDIQTTIKCTESNNCLNNTSLPGTYVSIDQLSSDVTRCVINDTTGVSCKQSNLSSKVEMTDISAQTDVSATNETLSSQKECLPSNDVVDNESETHSPSDYVDVGDASDLSSNPAYCDSVDSNDSGRGDSEILYDESAPYCCEFPSEKTSQLIGRGGNFKYEIERKSGVKLWVYPHECKQELNLVCMIGTGAQIETAKGLIKERFRHVTLKQWLGFNPINPPLSYNYLPVLPECTNFMGVASCICNPGFFWLQQYGHPQMYSLEDLERRMSNHFNTVTDAPGIDNPTIGSIIAVPACKDGDSTKWIRGCIINMFPDEETLVVRYLDHGGDHIVPISSIRPMRHDFFSMPFFAALSCLHDILPTGGIWSEAACAEFTRLCNSSTYPPIVRVIYKTSEFYVVTMYGYDPELDARVDIASHLIAKGLGVRPPLPATEFSTELQQ